MAAVGAVNLIIQKGTYFEEIFTFNGEDGVGLNLNLSSATAKLKKHPTAGIAYTFSTTLTVADSTIKISMPSNVTANLPRGRCYYDIVLTSPLGLKTKIVEGNVLVEETVST